MRFFILIISFPLSLHLSAQHAEEDIDFSNMENQVLQNFAELSDVHEEELKELTEHPVNINHADEILLATLPGVSAWQIEQLIKYRRTLGLLSSVYELQSVPGWDVALCRHLRPYLTVSFPATSFSLQKLEHQILFRMGVKDVFSPVDPTLQYHGSKLSVFVKYAVRGKNWQGGITGEKDPGENFMFKRHPYGFDHYGFYIAIKKAGVFNEVTIGDYTINLGQGLLNWMNIGFGKSTDISQIKRQGPVIKPYRSGGEGKYFRGIAFSINRSKWESDLFASYRKVDAHLYKDQSTYFTSIQTSGLHRTSQEIRDRADLGSFVCGLRIKKQVGNGNIAFQGIFSRYQFPQLVPEIPYRFYERAGSNRLGISIDHSYTYQNLHFFGETALAGRYPAFLEGLIIALGPRLDASLLFRDIHPGYGVLYGNIIGEHADPGNERGLLAGLAFKINQNMLIRGFTDQYAIPWLQYRVDVPAKGRENAIELQYKLSRKASLTLHRRLKEGFTGMQKSGPIGFPIIDHQVLHRLQADFTVNEHVKIRLRADWNKIQPNDNHSIGRGNSFSADIDAQGRKGRLKINGHMQVYETDSYETRIYGFERGVQGGSSLGSVYGQGSRLYVNLKYDVNNALCGWIKFGQGYFPLITNADLPVTTPSKSINFDIQLAILQKF